jgi:hypothetical protein
MARWDSCNILQTGADANRVWQFNKNFTLKSEQTARADEIIPQGLVGKSWSALWQSRVNIAWLPPEHVFIRVAQLPPSTPEETRTMVELQLEKLSPIPVTQVVWSMHILPAAKPDALQTVVVVIAERSTVEAFLGKLEGQGFLTDRLELPMLDQLQAASPDGDGAWIYPEAGGGKNTALVAWWYGGVLQSVGFLTLPAAENRPAALRDELTQMAWAGELEGWLTSPPHWHLVADASAAAEWEPALREGLDTSIKVSPPLTGAELAARTARRAAEADGNLNLLPPDFAKRYRQQFVDRLWMRGLLWVLAAYVAGCVIYFIAVQVLNYQTNKAVGNVANLGLSYTNALELQARYNVLKDREALKFAALDVWNAIAENMPPGLTLDSMNFNDGKRVMLNGTAPSSQVSDVIDFSGKVKKAPGPDGKPLFDPLAGEPLQESVNPGSATVRWSFGLVLKKGEKD